MPLTRNSEAIQGRPAQLDAIPVDAYPHDDFRSHRILQKVDRGGSTPARGAPNSMVDRGARTLSDPATASGNIGRPDELT